MALLPNKVNAVLALAEAPVQCQAPEQLGSQAPRRDAGPLGWSPLAGTACSQESAPVFLQAFAE